MAEPAALRHELKVKLPVRLIYRLHQEKITRGAAIQDSVTAALAAYFAASPR